MYSGISKSSCNIVSTAKGKIHTKFQEDWSRNDRDMRSDIDEKAWTEKNADKVRQWKNTLLPTVQTSFIQNQHHWYHQYVDISCTRGWQCVRPTNKIKGHLWCKVNRDNVWPWKGPFLEDGENMLASILLVWRSCRWTSKLSVDGLFPSLTKLDGRDKGYDFESGLCWNTVEGLTSICGTTVRCTAASPSVHFIFNSTASPTQFPWVRNRDLVFALRTVKLKQVVQSISSTIVLFPSLEWMIRGQELSWVFIS